MIDKNSMLPIYYQIKEMLIAQIKSNQILPEEKIISEHEMVHLYGISRQPIVRAMNDLEKEGWIYRVQGKGSFCSPPKAAQHKNIGIVLNTIENYIGGQIIDGITSALSQRDYSGIVRNVRYAPSFEYETVLDMIHDHVGGFILNNQYQFNTFSRHKGVLNEIEQRHIPFVIVDASFENTDVPYVAVNDVQGGYIATAHLLSLGHRNIMLFSPHIGWPEKARMRGYEKALKEYGMVFNPEYIICGIMDAFGSEDTWRLNKGSEQHDITATHSYRCIKEALEKHPEITAAVCYNDLYASLLAEVLNSLGRKVPRDMSIVGFDDSQVAVAGSVKFTTVAHPKFAYGVKAANVLVDIIEGKKPHDYQEIMDVKLIVRESSQAI